jgi:predicted RNA-binding protein with PIN domain
MFLVDGHNLIGFGLISGINLHQEDDEARLVAWLRSRQSNLRQKIVVFFDGGVPGGTSLALSGGGVTVIFAAKYRTDADTLILSWLHQHRTTAQIIVVTNDVELRQSVRSLGAQVERPAAFVQRLQQSPRRTIDSSSTKLEPKLSRSEVEEWLQLFGGDE